MAYLERVRSEISSAVGIVEREFSELELRLGEIPIKPHSELKADMKEEAKEHLKEAYKGKGCLMRWLVRPLHMLGYAVYIHYASKEEKRKMEVGFSEYNDVLYVNDNNPGDDRLLPLRAIHEAGHFAIKKINPNFREGLDPEIELMINEGFGEYLAIDVLPKYRPELRETAKREGILLLDFADKAEKITAARYDPRAPYSLGYKYLSMIASRFGKQALIDFLKNPTDPRDYIRARSEQ